MSGVHHKGIVRDTFRNIKQLKKTNHTHHPVDDAMGNAEAFLRIIDEFKIKIGL